MTETAVLGAPGVTIPWVTSSTSLENKVRAIGLPIVSQKTVITHMRKMDGRSDVDLARIFTPIREIWAWASFYRPAQMITNGRFGSDSLVALGLGAGSIYFTWWGFVPLVMAVIMALWIHLLGVGTWRHTTDFASLDEPAPQQMKDRAATLTKAGISWRIAWILDDPLLLATRGWGPFRREICVGGWATRVPEIDNA